MTPKSEMLWAKKNILKSNDFGVMQTVFFVFTCKFGFCLHVEKGYESMEKCNLEDDVQKITIWPYFCLNLGDYFSLFLMAPCIVKFYVSLRPLFNISLPILSFLGNIPKYVQFLWSINIYEGRTNRIKIKSKNTQSLTLSPKQ